MYEGRDIGTFDVTGAYLHAEMTNNKYVLLKLEGDFVDIMCRMNPEYENIFVIEKGKKFLYLIVVRSIYGCVESSLILHELFSSTIKQHGFKINPNDRCVANKSVNGKQCTIAFDLNDNKISHVEHEVVTSVIDIIKEYFSDLTLYRGK